MSIAEEAERASYTLSSVIHSKVYKKINYLSFRLELPGTMKAQGIHDIFIAVFQTIHFRKLWSIRPITAQMNIQEGLEGYEVEAFFDLKKTQRKNNKTRGKNRMTSRTQGKLY